MSDDQRLLRFRVLVQGQVVHEAWAPETPAEKIALDQGNICAAAAANGDPFEVEVYDPDLPPEIAVMRMGSDAVRMRHPTLIEEEKVSDEVMADYRRRLRSAGLL